MYVCMYLRKTSENILSVFSDKSLNRKRQNHQTEVPNENKWTHNHRKCTLSFPRTIDRNTIKNKTKDRTETGKRLRWL